ncbi:MAG: L,D-transpeptidase family protein [Arenimonas sp.]
MSRIALTAFCFLGFAASAFAQEQPEADSTIAPDANELAPVDSLKPGEYQWLDSKPAPGTLIVVVSLDAQRAYVYRNGQRIATSTISSGQPGRETPTGVYPILAKEKMHHSNLYNNAAMPFMQRLTWDGVALHAGRIPGHPASHGCVRLPREFARDLFALTERGQTVVISEDDSAEALVRVGLPDYLALQVGRREDVSIANVAINSGGNAASPRYQSQNDLALGAR